MSYSEFLYWQAFNLLEPIGLEREDWMQANISKALIDSNVPNHGFEVKDFRIFYEHREKTKEELSELAHARFASFVQI
ncbi:phage tail assembly protein T [Acinetobacter soli]|uniref:phage tail assembly protein T n=1 Tax=Acinetobacter soli TaxID=487316 RepID=UPI00125084E5|nr:DUF4035 domain-containing protein [Acinetobacter soli]